MGYQDAAEEAEIVGREAPVAGPGPLGRRAVAVVRATRDHPDVRVGSSVRGAIDLALLAEQLADLRGSTPADEGVGLDAALAALSGRIRVREGSGRPAEDVIRELWAAHPAETDEPTDDSESANDPAGDGPDPSAGPQAGGQGQA
jgi:MoxR-like ATPase